MSADVASTAQTWRKATALAVVASACGVLLGGVSAWFLGSVAIAGLSAATAMTFNFFAPGAMVRLFAVGRTVARYGERLMGHKAALGDQVERRIGLFSTMAAARSTRVAGWQLGDQSRLADYLDDVEDVDYAKLRAGLPTLTLALSIAACAAACATIAPLALLPISLLLLGLLVLSRRAAKAGAMAWELARALRRGGAVCLGDAMASVVPLKAERAWSRACADATSLFGQAEAASLSLRRSQAAIEAYASTIGPLSCLSVVAAAYYFGARGAELLVPMFLGFAFLALGETVAGCSRIVVARIREHAAAASIGHARAERPTAHPTPVGVAALTHDNLPRRAPDGHIIGEPVSLRLHVGRPTLLVGTSGVGKTSLLKQIAGWIGTDRFIADRTSVSADQRRAMSTLCLHDAAILDDTVRANLFASGAPEGLLWEALATVEMEGRIGKAGGLDAWIRQDMLSLGEAQRLNLARAWLSESPVVLIDEPTEHLDEAQGDRILRRLLHRLSDRILVISTHRKIPETDVDILELRQ